MVKGRVVPVQEFVKVWQLSNGDVDVVAEQLNQSSSHVRNRVNTLRKKGVTSLVEPKSKPRSRGLDLDEINRMAEEAKNMRVAQDLAS